jgi:hypothetical protein
MTALIAAASANQIIGTASERITESSAVEPYRLNTFIVELSHQRAVAGLCLRMKLTVELVIVASHFALPGNEPRKDQRTHTGEMPIVDFSTRQVAGTLCQTSARTIPILWRLRYGFQGAPDREDFATKHGDGQKTEGYETLLREDGFEHLGAVPKFPVRSK